MLPFPHIHVIRITVYAQFLRKGEKEIKEVISF